MIKYCISRGKGTLVESGELEDIEGAEALFEIYTDQMLGAKYGEHSTKSKSDGEIKHYQRGDFSMTVIPENFSS